MNETKTIFILGGTGFVGRALTEKYLKNNWRVIISTRAKNLEEAKSQLFLHNFDKNFFEKSFSNNFLLFAFAVDLADEKWSQIDIWTQLLKTINASPLSILRVANLVGETSKSADEILRSNVNTLEGIFTLVRYIKNQNRGSLFVNIGSPVEKRYNKRPSPYEHAKEVSRQQIEKSKLCDFHFVAHYIKGKGEQKMKSTALILWSKLKFSQKWLFGFKVGVVDVDDLAEIIHHLLEEIKIPVRGQKPVEVNVTNGELIFGEIIRNLLPEDKQSIPKAIIPARLEGLFLWLYSVIVPILKPNDQFARRLTNFAKRGLVTHKKWDETEIFKTAEDIKKLATNNDYEVLVRSPNLIVLSKRLPVIYVLKEKNQEELKRVVRKALAT
ncbi:MAG: SDR family oxidoreductase [Thermotogota bacterium]|nr:SDR family oxidoreductase [Thermotogota bacterium]